MEKLSRPKLQNLLPLLILIPVAIGGAAFLLTSASRIIIPVTVNYSEDSILVMIAEILKGNSIYTPGQYLEIPYNLAPYTPLYYYIVAIVDSFAGITLTGGRVVAFASSLLCALLVGVISRRSGASRSLALCGSLMFLTLYPVIKWSALHRVDFTAIMFTLAGVYLVVNPARSSRHLTIAIIMFYLAFMTKHSSVSAPTAAFLCLFFTDRKDAIRFAAILGGLIGLSVLLLNISADGGFIYSTSATFLHPFSMARFKALVFNYFLRPGFIVMIIIWVYGVIAMRRDVGAFLLLWPLLSIAQSLVGASKIGAGPSYFIEPAATLCIVWPTFLRKMQDERKILHAVATVALAGAIIAGFYPIRDQFLVNPLKSAKMVKQYEQGVTVSDIIDRYGAGKYALSEYPEFVIGTRAKPATNDPLTLSILSSVGAWDQTGMLKHLKSGDIAMVISESILPVRGRTNFITPQMEAIILEDYVIAAITMGNVVYIHKTALPPLGEGKFEP